MLPPSEMRSFLLGSVITIIVYISLGCRQIQSYEEEEEEEKSVKRQSSNLNPDDRSSKHSEILCVTYRRQGDPPKNIL